MAKCTGTRCPMQYGYKVEECNHTDCPYRTEPITNADRIHNWNDHELAETIANFVSEIVNGDVRYSDEPNDWLKWLQQPAE